MKALRAFGLDQLTSPCWEAANDVADWKAAGGRLGMRPNGARCGLFVSPDPLGRCPRGLRRPLTRPSGDG